MDESEVRRVYGPEQCPRPCADCPDGRHHWLADWANPDDDEDVEDFQREHPGIEITEGLMLAHYACKHCPAVGVDCESEAVG